MHMIKSNYANHFRLKSVKFPTPNFPNQNPTP